jgi:hypothetical protein
VKRAISLVVVVVAIALIGWFKWDEPVQRVRAQAPDGLFVPIKPQRVVDTRRSDDLLDISSKGSFINIDLLSLLEIDGIVKDSIIGVFAHITVLDATVPGHVTAFPSTQNRPDSSVVNFANGEISSNSFFIATPFSSVTRLGMMSETGKSGTANIIVDISGLVTSDFTTNNAARLVVMTPTRVFDSRRGTVIKEGSITQVDFTSNEVGVVAVAVNITADNQRVSSKDTFIGLMADGGAAWPETSLINVDQRETKSNFAIVPVTDRGVATFFNAEGDTNLIIDQVGYFTTDQVATTTPGRIVLLDAPFRVLDSRPNSLGAGQQVTWDFQPFIQSLGQSRSGLENARAFFGNFTAVNVRRRLPGLRVRDFITIFPSGTSRPDTSNITVSDGQTLANSGLFTVSNSGLDIYNDDGIIDYLLDVSTVITG